MIGPDGTPSGLIAHLHVLRQQALVVQTAAAAEALTAHMAAAFAQACDQAARATLDLAEAARPTHTTPTRADRHIARDD